MCVCIHLFDLVHFRLRRGEWAQRCGHDWVKLGCHDAAFAKFSNATNSSSHSIVILLIELVPLVILAPGMLLGSARGHSWMCFAVNLYFIKGALAAYDPNRQWFGVLEMLASLAVFCTALLYVRWRHQLNRRLAED